MLYAIIEGIKKGATPGNKGMCPFCQNEMVAKCGQFKSWHWAHKRIDSCDAWYKSETEWHRNWKQIFGVTNCEVILTINGQKHIADIQTIHGKIIELQNSPINLETLVSREDFYAPNLIWIINGINFAHNFIIKPLQATEYDTYTPEFDRFAKIHGFTPTYKSKDGENKARFAWTRPKQVWTYAKAQVFIDFGDEFLFFVKERLGSATGIGESVSKRQFIIDHGGNDSLISTIITSK
ncbi:MAG: competence protein CoiA family protein [Chitinophagaceae bacterium]